MKNVTNKAPPSQDPVNDETAAELRDVQPLLDVMRTSLRIVTGKWKGEILWSLKDGKRRFGELKRGIPGITQHMLTAQLRDLECHGLITRTIYAEVPPRVEYELTPVAYDLQPVFEEIMRWTERHADTLRLGATGNAV